MLKAHIDYGVNDKKILVPHYTGEYLDIKNDLLNGKFDNPNYDLKKVDGKYYPVEKGEYASERYLNTQSETIRVLNQFINDITYRP